MRGRASRLIAAGLSLGVVMALAILSVPSTTAQTPGVYISLGDSIAAGVGSSLPRERGNAAFVADWLRRLTGQTIPAEQLAVPGETATTFLQNGQIERLREAVARAQAAGIPIVAVSVSLGGNELLGLAGSGLSDRQEGLREFAARYNDALSAIRDAIGPDVPLVALTVYDPTGGDSSIANSDSWWIAQFNDVIRSTAATHGAAVVELPERFANEPGELTHYPYDIHPTNAGHLAIAQAIWETLALDTEPPTIQVEPELQASRPTPTIRFAVADNVGVAGVSATSDTGIVHGPFETGDNEYAVLLEFGEGDATLTIEIRDDAGNISSETVVVRR